MEFDDEIESLLIARFGDDAVESNHRFDETNRRVDWWVVEGDEAWAIETETRFGGVLDSVGQVLMYAGHAGSGSNPPTIRPMVLYPDGTMPQPEGEMLSSQTDVLFPVTADTTAEDLFGPAPQPVQTGFGEGSLGENLYGGAAT